MLHKSVRLYCIIFIVFFSQITKLTFGQERILTGKITDSKNLGLPFANVNLLNNKETIVKYTTSNKDGIYKITMSSDLDLKDFWIEVNFLGFKKSSRKITFNIDEYNFILQEDPTNLNEVIVKNRPILERLGDTLRYQVMSFTKPEDRSIGDVLRRMPGISISDDGTIYFNGEKIENLYIHGDDLMDGRYGLATKAIKKEDIESVDVINNHQPIKVLKDNMPTGKTAINLVLKDENSFKLSGKISIGLGLPKQYNAELTPIILNKKIKMLNSLAANNSGIDYKNDFKQLSSANLIENINEERVDFSLSQGTISPPNLPTYTYYFNNSEIININNIYNTKNGPQFKVNIQGYLDKNSLNYNSYTENYTSNDTTFYNENQSIIAKQSQLNTSFNIMLNKTNYFFINNLKINFINNKDSSFLNFNDKTFKQGLKKHDLEFSNDINWIPKLGTKGIGELRWLTGYKKNTVNLNIGDGYYFAVGNQQGYYDNVIQLLEIPILYSNAYLSYRYKKDNFNQEYKIGYLLEQEQLDTELGLKKNNQTFPFLTDSGNNLFWNKKAMYTSAIYNFKFKKFKTDISLPINYQNIDYNQKEYALNSKNKNLIFNPNIKILYNFSVEQRLSAKFNSNNSFGSISNVYQGIVLKNFRMLEANNADLQEKKRNSYNLNYDFEKSVSVLFINAGINYSTTSSNVILSSEINDNIQKSVLLPFKNEVNSTSFNFNISKYFFDLNSTFSVTSQFTKTGFQQIINNEIIPFNRNNLSITSRFIKKLFKKIDLTYQQNNFWSKSSLKNKNSSQSPILYYSNGINSDLKLGFNAFQSYRFEVNTKYSRNWQTGNSHIQYLFSDIKFNHTFKKKGLDLSLEVTNIFNVKKYTMYSADSYQLNNSEYELRGLMGMLKLDFYF